MENKPLISVHLDGEPSLGVDTGEVIDAMLTYGGGFVKALASAWTRADAENIKRLHAAFPDLWNRYFEMAKADKARRHA